MSVYAQINENGEQYQIASNLGWSQFGDWVESLDTDKFQDLAQLWEDGVSENVEALKEQLDSAQKEVPPTDDVASIVQTILDALEKEPNAEMVLVTNGAEPDDT